MNKAFYTVLNRVRDIAEFYEWILVKADESNERIVFEKYEFTVFLNTHSMTFHINYKGKSRKFKTEDIDVIECIFSTDPGVHFA